MLSRLTYPPVSIEDYARLLSPIMLRDLMSAAKEVQHLRFVHLNSTAVGGGVAEILQSLVPMMNSLGVETERIVITPAPEFFQVTKRIHNLLQGAEGALSAEEWNTYYGAIQGVVEAIQTHSLQADVWFLHDPQLLPLAQMLPKSPSETRLWVCHIDLTAPNRHVMGPLLPLTEHYDGLIFSLPSYVPAGIGGNTPVYIAPPAIDPLTVKNTPMGEAEALAIVSSMGIDPNRPLITQVSRFDFWKDPWGVITAFRIAREEIPGLQLALLGLNQATDDPEGQGVLNSVSEWANRDPDIHLYFDPANLTASIDSIVNAFQAASAVLIQKSTREGFGLTVTEGMWKGRAVIGGNVGGICTQIDNGETGYLVDSPEECGERIVSLLKDPTLRARMGAAARERVRRDFLLPRLTLDYLQAARKHTTAQPALNDQGINKIEKPATVS
ncbi:MAG: glycosyltransferase [Chloroflexi bacterium]|nr:glycosyltransferase [Chloroflexota bacterium]